MSSSMFTHPSSSDEGCLASGTACAHRTKEMHLKENLQETGSSKYNIPVAKITLFYKIEEGKYEKLLIVP